MTIKLKLENLTFGWGKNKLLFDNHPDMSWPPENIQDNLAIRKLPLMGKSGCGKSTLLYLLSALNWPTQGKISWQLGDTSLQWDHDPTRSNMDLQKIRTNKFGFIFQTSTLSDHMTIRENLELPYLLQNRPIGDLAKKLTDVNIEETCLSKLPDEVSIGQKQRIAVLQVMLQNPQVIFADEPTGSLDPINRAMIMSMLKNWVENNDERNESERLLLWVSHHIDDLEFMGVEKGIWVEKTDDKSPASLQISDKDIIIKNMKQPK